MPSATGAAEPQALRTSDAHLFHLLRRTGVIR